MRSCITTLSVLAGLTLPLAAAAQDSRTVRTIGRQGSVAVMLGERGGTYTLVAVNSGNREARVRFEARITCKNRRSARREVDLVVKAGGRNGEAWRPFPCGNDGQIQSLSAANLDVEAQGPTVRGGPDRGGAGAKRAPPVGHVESRLKRGIFGFRLGVNLSTLSYADTETAFGEGAQTGLKLAPGFGLIYDLALNPVLGVRAAIETMGKGANISGGLDASGRPSEVSTTILHSQWSFMLTARLGSAQRRVRPFLQLGPYFGFNVWANTRVDGRQLKDAQGNNISLDPFNGLDGGLAFGGGAFFDVGTDGMLSADLRADIGLVDLACANYWRPIDRGQTIHNRTVEFALAYHF